MGLFDIRVVLSKRIELKLSESGAKDTVPFTVISFINLVFSKSFAEKSNQIDAACTLGRLNQCFLKIGESEAEPKTSI